MLPSNNVFASDGTSLSQVEMLVCIVVLFLTVAGSAPLVRCGAGFVDPSSNLNLLCLSSKSNFVHQAVLLISLGSGHTRKIEVGVARFRIIDWALCSIVRIRVTGPLVCPSMLMISKGLKAAPLRIVRRVFRLWSGRHRLAGWFHSRLAIIWGGGDPKRADSRYVGWDGLRALSVLARLDNTCDWLHLFRAFRLRSKKSVFETSGRITSIVSAFFGSVSATF